MRKQDIVIGIIAIVAILFVVNRARNNEPDIATTPSPPTSEQKLEDLLNRQLPDSGERIELKDVLGVSATAIATRQIENNTTKITVLADLPNLEVGHSYQAWASSGAESDPNYEQITLGLLSQAKGGWLGEFEINQDLSAFNNILITREKSVDGTPETTVSTGTFTE